MKREDINSAMAREYGAEFMYEYQDVEIAFEKWSRVMVYRSQTQTLLVKVVAGSAQVFTFHKEIK